MFSSGQGVPSGRQFLSRFQARVTHVCLAQKKQIIEFPLLAARPFLLVCMKLALSQALDNFTFPSCLLIDALLLIAQRLGSNQLPAHSLNLLLKRGFTKQRKLQLRGRCTRVQLTGALLFVVVESALELLDPMAYASDLLIRRPQAKFVLMLNAFSEVV